MTLLTSSGFIGEEATSDLFGGNVLATRSTMTGEGSYAELIDDLGTSVLRYPGGSLTETYFDLSNPDSSVVYDPVTGAARDFIPMSDFMEYAAANDHSVVLVIPTRYELSETRDANGNRAPDIDEAELRQFVNDAVTGVYGDAEIKGFELGNEYWGSGEMNSFEYGALAAEMSVIIDDELSKLAATHPETNDIEIVAQVGTNFNYAKLSNDYQGWDARDVIDDLNDKLGLDLDDSAIGGSGNINWTKLANQIVTSQFDTTEEIEALDGVVAHVYTKGPEYAGQRDFQLDTIQENWIENFEDLDIYVTEWNASGATSALDDTEDYGLFQAHEMLNIVEEMMEAGVDVANVWPLLQNTDNALSIGQDHSELTPPGEMFRMMAETIPGKQMIDLAPDDRDATETSVGGIDAHAFYGDGDLAFYFASTIRSTTTEEIDLSNFVSSADAITITVLGVEPGDAEGDTGSDAVVRTVDAADIYDGGTLTVTLNPGEVMQVVFEDIVPADEFGLDGADLQFAPDTVADPDDDGVPRYNDYIQARSSGGDQDGSEPQDQSEGEGDDTTGPRTPTDAPAQDATDFPVPVIDLPEDPEEGADITQRQASSDDDGDGGGDGGAFDLGGLLLLLPLMLLGGL